MPIFGDLVPRCCIVRKAMKWKYYQLIGHYHDDGDNTCMHCGMPAYKRWSRTKVDMYGDKIGGYEGYIGFCTTCEATWAES